MKTAAKSILTGTLLAAGFVGIASVAYAGYIDSGFDEIMPVGQFTAWSSAQTKAETSRPGFVHVSTVGSDYSVDIQQCENVPISCGAKVRDFRGGDEKHLSNTVAAGSLTRLQFQSHTWNSVKVEVSGYWHSN